MQLGVIKRLVGVLDAKKDRDAGALGVAQAEIATLDQERAALEAALTSADRDLAPASVAEHAALDKWRRATKRRLHALAEERRRLVAIAAERRDVLTRSNGESEAVKILLQAATTRKK